MPSPRQTVISRRENPSTRLRNPRGIPRSLPLPPPVVRLELLGGALADASVQVALLARFEGLELTGQNLLIDQRLRGLLRVALAQGMICSRLGEMTFLPVNQLKGLENPDQPLISPERLLVVSLGDPARYTLNDFRYVIMRSVMGVKLLEFEGFGISLVNGYRSNFRPERALQAIFDGISDAYDRLPYVYCETHTLGKPVTPFRLVLVEDDPERFEALKGGITSLVAKYRNESPIRLKFDDPKIGPKPEKSTAEAGARAMLESPGAPLTVRCCGSRSARSRGRRRPA